MKIKISLLASCARGLPFVTGGLLALCFGVPLIRGQAQQRPAHNPGTTNGQSSKSGGAPNGLAHHEITVGSLPPPRATKDAENPPRVIARPANAELQVPPGFSVSVFAEGGFEWARWMALAPNGDIFVSDADANSIVVLRDTDGNGTADGRFTFATGLNRPFGMAFWREYLYVGNTDSVVRFRYRAGQTKADGAPEKIAELPGRGYRQHWTRNIQFNPAGTKMYVTVGSATDVDAEPEPRASILEFNPDGSGRRIFASGLRNPIGLAFQPGTEKLWAAVQERDHLGDDLPPDYFTDVQDGGFYGWPYSYAGQFEDPRHRGERPDLVKRAIVPRVLIQPHSAVLGLVFYAGKMFPKEYRGDAFVALHGSWNRSRRTGYKVIRIKFKNGNPVGGYDDFLTGWMLGEDRAEVWGRPVGLLVLPDGSLLVADDGANKIWRITYRAGR